MSPGHGGKIPFEGEPNLRLPPVSFCLAELGIFRVNLGGWFVLEPFITPALFEKYSTAPVPPVDEYALTQLMRADGSLGDLEKHYQTWIVSRPRVK
jgi:glucan 1,3-beta-glucosidase